MPQEATANALDRTRPKRPSEIAAEERLSATEAALDLFTEYARERPEVVALWAFGIGFVLGWKLKPW